MNKVSLPDFYYPDYFKTDDPLDSQFWTIRELSVCIDAALWSLL